MANLSFTQSESEYLKINPTWHIEDSPWKADKIIKMIKRNKLHPKTIVEIGCGAGEILNQLHEHLEDKSIQYSGYEIAPDAFQLSLQRKKDRLEFFQSDLLEIDRKFDLLLMIDVFEHVDDYIGFIRKANEKATYKMYHIPLDMSVFSLVINNFKYVRSKGGHIHYFSQYTAQRTISDTGQEIIDWFYTPSVTDLYNKNVTIFTKFLNFTRKVVFKISPDAAAKYLGGYSLMILAK